MCVIIVCTMDHPASADMPVELERQANGWCFSLGVMSAASTFPVVPRLSRISAVRDRSAGQPHVAELAMHFGARLQGQVIPPWRRVRPGRCEHFFIIADRGGVPRGFRRAIVRR